MAYISCIEVAEGRSGNVDFKYQREYVRNFKVVVDTPTYGAYYAASCPSLPVIYSIHPEDPRARCIRLTPSQSSEDPTLWEVRADYAYSVDFAGVDPRIDSQQLGVDPGSRQQDPMLRLNDYSISTAKRPWSIVQDQAGNAILNSAGDPFIPPPEIEIVEATITIGMNSLVAPTPAWLGSVGKVNSNSMIIGPYAFGIGTLRMAHITAQPVYEYLTPYWRWSIEFGYRPSWQFIVLDAGLRQLVGGKLVPIYDPGTAIPTSVPLPLNGFGSALAAGGVPQFRAFDIYPRVSFPSPL